MQHTLALARHAEGAHLTADEIFAALDHSGSTTAGITYVSTSDKPKAALKQHVLRKVCTVQAMLFKSAGDVGPYVKRVCKEAGKEPKEWVHSETHYTHTEQCYSIVENKKRGTLYLWCMIEKANGTTYYVDGQEVSKAEYASYLTPSSANKLLNPSSTTHNKTNDIVHSTTIRTPLLHSVMQLNVNKQQLAA